MSGGPSGARGGLGPGAAAPPAPATTRRARRACALPAELIGHALALRGWSFLQPGPPRGHLRRGEPELGAQQQQVVAGAEARVLEHAQCAAAARVLEPWLQSEHLAHPERKALRNSDMCLCLAHRLIAGLEYGGELVPALR